MPITSAGMDSANSAGVTSYTLPVGVDVKLYKGIAASGAIASVFGIPPQSSVYRGMMILSATPVGATTFAAGVCSVEVSLDGGGTFRTFLSTITLCAAGTMTPQRVDLSGLGGNGQLRLNFTTFTLGTASSVDVWAHIG